MTGEITGNFFSQAAFPTQDRPCHLAFNQLVEGSIPSPRTFWFSLFSPRKAAFFAGSSYVEQALAVG